MESIDCSLEDLEASELSRQVTQWLALAFLGNSKHNFWYKIAGNSNTCAHIRLAFLATFFTLP